MKVWSGSLLLAACALAAPALAHHSYAMFDRSRTVAMTGQVKEFDMIAPHGWLVVVAQGADRPQTWSFEMGPPRSLERQGWTASSVQAGDQVELRFHPVKDGSFGGQLVSVRLPDGKMLAGGPTSRLGGDEP